VAAGQIIAVLDSLPQLEAARDSATAALAVREAALVQTRAAIAASRREAEAARDRAAAALRLATSELERARELSGRGITAQAALDRAELAEIEAARELDRSNAALSRYAGIAEGTQPDILRAERDVAAARADLCGPRRIWRAARWRPPRRARSSPSTPGPASGRGKRASRRWAIPSG
jgi:HlyD family secretion protein